MCCKTEKFKGFRSNRFQSSQLGKTSIAPYRRTGMKAQRRRNKVVKFLGGNMRSWISFWLHHSLAEALPFLSLCCICKLGGLIPT